MVELRNLTKSRVNERFLRKIVERVVRSERKKLNVAVIIVGPKRMKELNKLYRKKNSPTDVLSFRYDDSGEVVLCLREIKKNAKRFNAQFQEELVRVLIHGVLHLFGYDHEKSETGARKMETKQNYH